MAAPFAASSPGSSNALANSSSADFSNASPAPSRSRRRTRHQRPLFGLSSSAREQLSRVAEREIARGEIRLRRLARQGQRLVHPGPRLRHVVGVEGQHRERPAHLGILRMRFRKLLRHRNRLLELAQLMVRSHPDRSNPSRG